MRISNRRMTWSLALVGVALLPIGMTVAVMAAFARPKPAAPAPKVVAAWVNGPMEVQVAFDQPIDPVVAVHSVGHVIRFGGSEPGSAGAQGRPGGDVGMLRISAARMIDENRTLVLTTDPHPREATYTLSIAEIKSPSESGLGRSEVVHYSLAGVDVTWSHEGSQEPTWSGWWPDLDPALVQAALAGSRGHERLWPLLKRPGKLVMRSFVRLAAGESTSVITSNDPFEASLGSESVQSGADHRATLKLTTEGEPVELTLTLTTLPTGPEEFNLHWAIVPLNAPEKTPQALPRSAFEVEWAPAPIPQAPAPNLPTILESGGDPARGAIVFASEEAKCATCHQVRGQGGNVGPDLSSLAGASRAWVFQSIMEPSVAIHPDYLSYAVAMKDGRVGMGIVRAEGADKIRVGSLDAQYTTYSRDEVEELRPSNTSIMPVGLLGALGDDKTRDLLAFLTSHTPAVPASQPVR